MPQGHNFLFLKLEKIRLNLRGEAPNSADPLGNTLFPGISKGLPTLPLDSFAISQFCSNSLCYRTGSCVFRVLVIQSRWNELWPGFWSTTTCKFHLTYGAWYSAHDHTSVNSSRLHTVHSQLRVWGEEAWNRIRGRRRNEEMWETAVGLGLNSPRCVFVAYRRDPLWSGGNSEPSILSRVASEEARLCGNLDCGRKKKKLCEKCLNWVCGEEGFGVA